MRLFCLLFLNSSTFLSVQLSAQNFPFAVSPLEETSGVIDLSFLNEVPAGKRGFISVSGKDFVDGSGKPLRFWGVNTTGEAGLPAKSDAPLLAHWLAAKGFNILRLHFLDRNWGPGGILRYPDSPEGPAQELLDPVALDKLDFFQAELKKNGVYVNLNLHVGRTYGESSSSPLGDFSKGVDNFYPAYGKALKSYARALLTHTNPYTGFEWRFDPALALVEVNNENSLLAYKDILLSRLEEPQRQELKIQWQTWLGKKFPDQAAFREHFSSEAVTKDFPLPVPGIKDFSQWNRETHEGALAHWSLATLGEIFWEILTPGSESWHIQLNLDGLSWKEGDLYRFTVQGRSPQNLVLEPSFMRAEDPWESSGVSENWTLDKDWKTYVLEGRMGRTMPKGRINLASGTTKGQIFLRQPLWERISTQAPDPRDPDLPSLRNPSSYNQAFQEFLEAVDKNYALDFHDFLKNELLLRCPVAQTQADYGGRAGLERETAVSDWIDIHAYHDHPWFPGKAWDPTNWRIGNTPLPSSGGSLSRAAFWRSTGKPFILSEWNIPAPNEYRLATVPAAAVMASLQDWSGVCLYTLSDFDAEYKKKSLEGYFDLYNDPSRTLLMPWGALVFRNYLIPALQEKRTWSFMDFHANSWDWFPGKDKGETEDQALRWQLTAQNSPSVGLPPSRPPAFPLAGPSGVSGAWWVWGALQGKYSNPLGKIHITGWTNQSFPWGGVFIVSLDGKPLEQSRRVFLASLSKAENPDAQWNGERTSLGENWGKKPVEVSGPLGTVEWERSGWKVHVLDENGQVSRVLRGLKVNLPAGERTLGYLLTR